MLFLLPEESVKSSGTVGEGCNYFSISNSGIYSRFYTRSDHDLDLLKIIIHDPEYDLPGDPAFSTGFKTLFKCILILIELKSN